MTDQLKVTVPGSALHDGANGLYENNVLTQCSHRKCFFPLTFLIFSESELHSCCAADTVARKPCGAQKTLLHQ